MGALLSVESRRATRIYTAVPVRLEFEPRSDGIESHVFFMINLSEHGMRVRGRVPLTPGQILGIVLSKHPQPCRVAWADSAPTDGETEAGLEFLAPLYVSRHPAS